MLMLALAANALLIAPWKEEYYMKRDAVLDGSKVVYKPNYNKTCQFILYEMLEHSIINYFLSGATPIQTIQSYSIRQLPFHLITSRLPVQLATTLHFAWNARAVATQYNMWGMTLFRGLWLLIRAWWQKRIQTHVLETSRAVGPEEKRGASVTYPETPVGNDAARAVQFTYGFQNDKYRPVAYAPNYDNEVVAVKCRLLAATPVPVQGTMDDYVRFCRAHLRDLLPRATRAPIAPLPFEEYLRMSGASPGVKRLLRKTRQALTQQGIDEHTQLTREQVRLWCQRKAFVKVENNNYRSPLGVKEKAPRLIQGATAEFICLVGPWIAALQRRVKRDLGVSNFACFSSGISARKLATKLADAVGEFGENDVSSWDVSNTEPLANLEVEWAQECGCPVGTHQLMHGNVTKRGRTSKGIKYKVKGIRASGDPYTSLFNTMHNLFMHIFLFCRHNRVSLQVARGAMVMLANGDDNAMVIHVRPGITMPDFVRGFAELGFESKFIRRDSLYELEYCSNRVYPVHGGHCFGPMPGKVLCKLGYIIDPPRNVSRESMMRGVALGLKPAVAHIPPLNTVCERIIQLTSSHQAYYSKHEEWKMTYTEQVATPATMDALGVTYGWSYASQDSFAAEVATLNLGDSSDFPLWNLLCSRDAGHPSL
jgi:hypothetical protein